MSDADSPKASKTDASTASKKDTAARVRRGLDYALLGGLVLLGAFAALQFYFAADRTINVWVTREYRPPFKMVFNLVVLLVVGIGLSRQVRRLTGTEDDDAEDAEDDRRTDATTDGGVESRSATTGERSPTATEAAGERASGGLASAADDAAASDAAADDDAASDTAADDDATVDEAADDADRS